MKKYIITTTISEPTLATRKFSQIADSKNWTFVVVGDTKTPHGSYKELVQQHNNTIYLTPDEQESLYKELSDKIGWKTIQRRNIGFVYAYKQGADIIATVDDDNIPYDSWGDDLYVGQEVVCDYYETENDVFDPLSVTNHNYLWHRGYPIDLLKTKNEVTYKGKQKRKVLIQADLWDGDPDVDAIARLTYKALVKFDTATPYFSNKISPFNSQNTFLAREVIPFYSVWPFVGRMDDIWGGYHALSHFKENLIYAPASVYQDRNLQDLITNLEKEVIGYRHTYNFIKNSCSLTYKDVPIAVKEYMDIYQKYFDL
jgi:hypothetical protein